MVAIAIDPGAADAHQMIDLGVGDDHLGDVAHADRLSRGGRRGCAASRPRLVLDDDLRDVFRPPETR